MKYSCNLVKDIIPLYIDEVASKESENVIEEHMETCETCREYLETMKHTEEVTSAIVPNDINLDEAKSYKNLIKRIICKIIQLIAIIFVCIVATQLYIYILIVAYFGINAKLSFKEYDDISLYESYRGENGIYHFRNDATKDIWPEKITNEMSVSNFIMVEYNPFDANYLGILETSYTPEAFLLERERLQSYGIEDCSNFYGAKGFNDYEVLAMICNENTFVYALTDGMDRVIYIQIIFPGWAMDIDYPKYIPAKYLPEGFDATEGNATHRMRMKQMEEYRELQTN